MGHTYKAIYKYKPCKLSLSHLGRKKKREVVRGRHVSYLQHQKLKQLEITQRILSVPSLSYFLDPSVQEVLALLVAYRHAKNKQI